MPEWKQEIRERLAPLKLAPTREAEIVEELAQHLEDRCAELLSDGAAPEEAHRAAFAELNTVSPANFFDWQEQNRVFEGMAAYADTGFNLVGDGEPGEIPAQETTANLFSVLGVNALLGRTFATEDGKPGQN